VKRAAFLLLVLLGTSWADVVHPNGCKGPVLCTSTPIIDGCGWTIEAGLILEQMRVSNTDVAEYSRSGAGTGSSPNEIETMINLGFNLEPGLRVSLGYEFDHDDWRLKAAFEWLYSNASYKNTVDTGSFFMTHQISKFNSSTDLQNEPLYRTLKANLEVNYFLLDVYMFRGSYLSSHFAYTPFVGIKTSWVDYRGSKRFSNDSDTDRLPSNTSFLNRNNINFWGVGPMIGMDGNYFVFAGWSIFSSGNISVLFGESHLKNQYGFVTAEDYPTGVQTLSRLVVLCPTMRALLGLQYDTDLFCDTQHFTFRIGFDSRYYFNQYPVVDYPARIKSEASATDLRLTGRPQTIENGSWGMLGLILDVAYDF